MPRDVVAFFESYRDAFNRLDGDAVADLYSHAERVLLCTAYEEKRPGA